MDGNISIKFVKSSKMKSTKLGKVYLDFTSDNDKKKVHYFLTVFVNICFLLYII